ncbi:MAG: glycosyltransferase family 9 protein [Pigmentiphaga sp.]
MALPALHLLSRAGYSLVLVGRPWARDLLAGLPHTDFIALEGPLRRDAQRLRDALHPGGKGLGTPYRGICFPDSLSSAMVFRMAGVRAGGYRDDGRSLLLGWPIGKPKGDLHLVESYHYLAKSVLQRWGHQACLSAKPPPTLDLPSTSAHERAAATLLERAGLRPHGFVLLSPTATGRHRGRVKAWAHYDELARALQNDGWPVAICPPPQEIDAAHQAAPTAQVLAALPLGAFAALTQKAALVVCNDSGTSHVAAAAGSRQITLFGVTRPERTGPWSPNALCLGNEDQWPEPQIVIEHARQLLAQAQAQA